MLKENFAQVSYKIGLKWGVFSKLGYTKQTKSRDPCCSIMVYFWNISWENMKYAFTTGHEHYHKMDGFMQHCPESKDKVPPCNIPWKQ